MQFWQLHLLKDNCAATTAIHLIGFQFAFWQLSAVEADALLIEDWHCGHHALLNGVVVVKTICLFSPVGWPEISRFILRRDACGFLNDVSVSHHLQNQAIWYAHAHLRSASHRQFGGIPHIIVIGVYHCVQALAIIA